MSVPQFSFRVTHTDGGARRGVMTTAHGEIDTPAFMPVGTQGAVKGVTHRDLEALGAEILLCNTYHLYLRPGADLIARRGGLHRFIGWTRPILTATAGCPASSLTSTVHRTCSRRKRRQTFKRSSDRTSRWCSTSAWRTRRRLARLVGRWSGRCDGRVVPASAGSVCETAP